MGWTASCQKKPKRNRRLIQFIFTDVRFYGGESPQYKTICWGNLQSLSSLIAKIPWPKAAGVQGRNHNRAFLCRSNPINCFPSTCSESVESDGEECVLSRCPTSNLSALKGRGTPGSRWFTGTYWLIPPSSAPGPFPLVKLKREELEIRSPVTSAPTLIIRPFTCPPREPW